MLDLGKTALPSVATDVPELCHLKVAAQRIGDVNYNLVAFHHRFFGPKSEEGEITAKPGETEGCYRNDMTAVFDAITRLETLVNDLTQIG